MSWTTFQTFARDDASWELRCIMDDYGADCWRPYDDGAEIFKPDGFRIRITRQQLLDYKR